MDFLAHQQRVLEAHARYAMHRRAQKEHATIAADHASKMQAAQAELDALAMSTPSDKDVLR